MLRHLPLPGPSTVRWLLALLIGLLVLLWAFKISSIQRDFGFFTWIGVDYRHYLTQAQVLREGRPGEIYSFEAVGRYGRELTPYAGPRGQIEIGSVPYVPFYPWLFQPFTLLPPLPGFALWATINCLAALYLARRIGSYFALQDRLWARLLMLTSLPVVYALMVGQPMVLLAIALANCFEALRSGRDFRAGLWLACLLIKPQYGLLLGPLLIWKRRWTTVAGVAVGAAVIFCGSLLAGWEAILAFPQALIDKAEFDGGDTYSYPEDMANWRRLVLLFFPELPDAAAFGLVALLSAATALATLSAWRGPWSPADPLFPAQFTALLVATILVSFHSHVYGPTLLALPLAATLADRALRRSTRTIVLAAIVLPALGFTLIRMPAAPFAVLLIASLAALLVEVERRRQGHAAPAIQPAHPPAEALTRPG